MSNRGNFSGRIGFILAAAGSAVGLGNIWRFPYLAGQNGGAVFLVFYLICVFLLCYPVMIGEIAIGRAAGTNAYGAYKKLGGGRWAWIGMFGILVGILILSFYNVVAGWAFGYFLNISFGSLLEQDDFRSFFGLFVNDILNLNSWQGFANSNLIFSMLFMIATAFIVSQGIQKGIEMANKVMMPSLYVILIGLIIYSLTLPNALAGVEFYLIPDFSEMNAQTVFDGLRQAFFSLSLGMGGLITYGSYLQKKENIVSSAAVISITDTSVAFLAGLMIFPLVFSHNMSPSEGPPLVFFVLPKVFQGIGPVLGRIVGASFFLLLCFAALTSTISLLEVPVAYLVDEKKISRKKAVWSIAALVFVAGLPSMISQGMVPALNKLPFYRDRDFLIFVSDLCDISLTVGGCLMCVFIATQWKTQNLDAELEQGNNGYLNSFMKKYLNLTIKYVCPILLGILSILIVIDKFWGLFTG
jgi:NSS family neurotransmitter:Na+ symporter